MAIVLIFKSHIYFRFYFFYILGSLQSNHKNKSFMFSIDKNQNGAANILAKGSIFALILPPFIFYQSFFHFSVPVIFHL